jgi:phosphatidate cytidylyltransferase
VTGVRIASAVVLVAVLLALLFLAPPSWTVVAIVAIVAGCAWEWSGFLQLRSLAPRLAYLLLTLLWFVAAAWLALAAGQLEVVLGIAALWWAASVGWLVCLPERGGRWSAAVAGWLVLAPAGVALLWLWLDPSYGLRWLLYVLLLVWAADTGAYFAGRAFGRHKLAPRVSPGKTWEGAAGGLLLVAVLAAFAAPVLGRSVPAFIALSLLVAVFSIVGDLIESLFKRHAGLKDSGSLIPGHGGLMDRLDSIMAAAPLMLLASRIWP